MNNDLKHEIWLLARNALYELEQAEVNSVREKLRRIMEIVSNESPQTV